jgi:hypothetical protein
MEEPQGSRALDVNQIRSVGSIIRRRYCDTKRESLSVDFFERFDNLVQRFEDYKTEHSCPKRLFESLLFTGNARLKTGAQRNSLLEPHKQPLVGTCGTVSDH